jgi:hypothetical protein
MTTTTTRRAVLAGLAAAPAAAVPAVAAAESDPIYAAIENHKRALLASFVTGRLYALTDLDHHHEADTKSLPRASRG